ncbi:CZB domain-containing protein [Solimicrobium silvestre]|uniref:MCP-signal associated domain n=1 Tax=Solimicrobium silvestre TaxID=2099400 RepID=A0A2S9GVD4_9BURK|nr:CZB domain-containing protein [Solimicrobium silvestre]PRC91674.1 MCP-signal associated domain [Solimicrobium silvestre]
MDLRTAYESDKELKDQFIMAIEANAQVDATVIMKSDRCALGVWLHGEAERKFKFLSSYKPCMEAHEAFHAQAAKVARQINLGEHTSARSMLADGTPYAKACSSLGSALIMLKKDAKI